MGRIVVLYDGRRKTGGLTNRFAGIISAFDIARRYNKKFEIKFSFPFDLDTFLVSNKYDWSYGQVASNREKTYMLIDDDSQFDELISDLDCNKFDSYYLYININILNRFYDKTNINYVWSDLFNILFKKTDYLISKINNFDMPDSYIAVHLRFLNRLGDFIDASEVEELDKVEKRKLISKCMDKLIQITNKHEGEKCYVTSDSNKFLSKLKNMNNLIVAGGRRSHTDIKGGSYDSVFVDFFLLSQAEKIYNVRFPFMHKSRFGEYAAMLNNVPFERIE